METKKPSRLIGLFANWISLLGLAAAAFGLIVSGTLLVLDILAHFSNPYLGIFTYVVGPSILFGGLVLALLGAWLTSRKLRTGASPGMRIMPVLDLNDPRHVGIVVTCIAGGLAFISISAIGSYRAYHFSDSVSFCGETCHSVMAPEHTAFQGSPHANVQCTTCHIGPGADWFVKSKLNGLRQVYNTLMNTYSRPIGAPVHDLRPAKETCNTCHWPEKFFGSVLLQRTYFRGDEENTPWTIAMLLKVGGGDREHGRPQGIHWHMAIDNKIEYVAADEKRLSIPWVRMTDGSGKVRVFQTNDEDEALDADALAKAEIRTMDCIDCHNRPSHQYHSPERALNEAMSAGHIDTSLESIKANASDVLTGEYETEAQAHAAIRKELAEIYDGEDEDKVEQAILRVQKIYSRNFFPEMKVDWMAYPDHIGHMVSPGCFRCHDGKHVSDDGEMITMKCESCHTIISQGPGTEVASITSTGLEFDHPTDDNDWKKSRCDECHEGLPVE